MTRPTFVMFVTLLAVATLPAPAAPLTLSERIEAQRRVEQVYWAQRTWPADNPGPKPALADVLDEKTLAERAEQGVLESALLFERFGVRIEPAALRGEIERMVRDTRRPAVLRDLFAALGDDPVLVAETLARPLVADRLLREAYEHAAGSKGNATATASASARPAFDDWFRDAARAVAASASLGVTVPAAADLGPLPTLPAAGCTDDTWSPMALKTPSRRYHQVEVWTGAEMLLWGGTSEYDQRQPVDAWRYNPATDTWTRLPDDPSPQLDFNGNHTGVWSGTELILMDGTTNGRRLNPTTGVWRSVSPGPVGYDTTTPAVWTGTRMLLWHTGWAAGGLYDPVSDTWSAMSTFGAPSPRQYPATLWTGSRFMVWSGSGNDVDGNYVDLPDGALYDPGTDEWTPMSTAGQPTPRYKAGIAWTGSEAVIWGGGLGAFFEMLVSDGARYNPATDTWTPISTSGAPSARLLPLAGFGSGSAVFWGGSVGQTLLGDGARYRPSTDTWQPISAVNAPAPRFDAPTVWTGSEIVVWGGRGAESAYGLDSGARYNPATDVWAPMARTYRPLPRAYHHAVWTGAEMLAWGATANGDGGAYDPATDAWRPLATSGAPSPRQYSVAGWTGSEMVVWGGLSFPDNASVLGDGARYNPTTNHWTPMTTTGAPSARYAHAGAWSGSLFLAWGGVSGGSVVGTGARYNPATDTWTPMTNANAPAPRRWMGSVWGGSKFLVWGGVGISNYFGDGSRYDPATDTWSAMSFAPVSPRQSPAMVWSGTEMLLWGGNSIGGSGTVYPNDGWRYNPATDTWHAMTTTGAPIPTSGVTGVWTGSKMVVWGGAQYGPANTGARYDPAADAWTDTRLDDSTPAPRTGHTAVWTGSEMIVWAGGFGGNLVSSGGRYCAASCTPVTWYRDADGDGVGVSTTTQSSCTKPAGYVAVAGDCNDADASVWGTPGEARSLVVTRSGGVATLTWTAPSAPGGTVAATRYDTVRSTSPSDFNAAATCLESDGADLQSTDAASPGAKKAFYYLVRAVNNCAPGDGPLGFSSAGVPIAGRACP